MANTKLQPKRNGTLVPCHLSAYTNINSCRMRRIRCGTKHPQNSRMIRVIHMSDLLIHSIYCQYILNQIVRSYTEEIRLLRQQISNHHRCRNFNHDPYLNMRVV
ncbi:hypothetical protein D3C74_400730 [compost metagenome]